MQHNWIRSSIEVVITGTTGNRVYPKRVPRVQIPPAPPEKKKQAISLVSFFLATKSILRIGEMPFVVKYFYKMWNVLRHIGLISLHLISWNQTSQFRQELLHFFTNSSPKCHEGCCIAATALVLRLCCYVPTTFFINRIRIAASCARVALSAGFRVPSV